jgi:hypothetical protein
MWRLALWSAAGQFQIDAAQLGEPRMNALIEAGTLRPRRPAQYRLQDAPRLCLHRVTVLSGAQAQTFRDRRIEIANVMLAMVTALTIAL